MGEHRGERYEGAATGREREALRGYFDFFKHLSAVSTAVLVVVLVLYRDLYLDPTLALLSLAAFGISVLASFYGMFLTMDRGPSEKPGRPLSLLRRLLYVAIAGFGGAVLCLVAGIVVAGLF
jgi:hypothetical protein